MPSSSEHAEQHIFNLELTLFHLKHKATTKCYRLHICLEKAMIFMQVLTQFFYLFNIVVSWSGKSIIFILSLFSFVLTLLNALSQPLFSHIFC